MISSVTSTLGAGSGIDVTSLISSLTEATRAPKAAALTKRETANTARISAMGTIASAVDSFAAALKTLTASGSVSRSIASSDPAIAGARLLPGVRLSTAAAKVEVLQMAQGQVTTSAAVAGAASPIGQGQLTLTVAGKSVALTIDASNDSLGGLAQAMNDSASGIEASVISDSDGSARLSVRGGEGAANGFDLALAAGDPAALGRFATAGAGSVLSTTQTALDARVAVDGIAVSRPGNRIDDLIPGMGIDLHKAAPGTIVGFSLTRPTDAIRTAMTDFVDAFNAVMGDITQAQASGASGSLYGNAAVSAIRQQLAKLPTTALVNRGSGPRTLAEIGLRTNRDGTVSLDSYRLANALSSNPDGVEAMFNPTQFSSDPRLVIKNGPGRVAPGVYRLDNLVAGSDTVPASGTIDGVAAIAVGGSLVAPSSSAALGLIVAPSGGVTAATVTVEAGVAGAVEAIRTALRSAKGGWTTTQQRLTNETKAIADDRAKLDKAIATYSERLVRNYSSMDSRVAGFKATQSYLTQQIKIWSGGN